MLYRLYKRKHESCEKIQAKSFCHHWEPLTDHFDPSVVLNVGLQSPQQHPPPSVSPLLLDISSTEPQILLNMFNITQANTHMKRQWLTQRPLSHDSQLLSCCALSKFTHTVLVCPEETCLGQSASICCFTWKTWMRLDRGFIWVLEGESIKQTFGEKNMKSDTCYC